MKNSITENIKCSTDSETKYCSEILCSGFSLIELILVIMLLSVSSTAMVSLLGQMGNSTQINQDTQTAAQLAQECAEYLLAIRRDQGYTMGGVSDCGGLSVFGGSVQPTVNIAVAAPGVNGCPGGATCKLVDIVASVNTSASSVQILLVDY